MELNSQYHSQIEEYELADRASRRIYKRITDNGQNNEALNYFRELTRSFEGHLNAIPTGSSIQMTRAIALEVYPISQIEALKRRLTHLFDHSPSLDASTRRSFHRRLNDFTSNTKFNAGMHSITHFHESTISLRSRLFIGFTFSLELVGGYLVRIYIHFKPADGLNKQLSAIAEEQYQTRLTLRHGLRGFRRAIVPRVDFGNTRKSKVLMKLDRSVTQDLCSVVGKRFLPGIYLEFFNGLPLVHTLTYSDAAENQPSSPGSSPSSPHVFLKLLLKPSPDYQQTQYHSDSNDVFVELRSRKKVRLESYSKYVTAKGDGLFSCFDVLPIFAEKEVLWLQASMLCELEGVFMRMIHNGNISGQRRKRFQIYRLSSLYRTFSKGFDNRIFFKPGAYNSPIAGLSIEVGNGKRLDYCEMGVKEIRSARLLFDEHLKPLLQACELAKDEASDSFQRWIQLLIVLLSLIAVPLAQVFWERHLNYHHPAKNSSTRIAH